MQEAYIFPIVGSIPTPPTMMKIAVGHGTGLAASIKTLRLVAQQRRALEQAKADADIRQILADIKEQKYRQIRDIRPPTPASRADPRLDNKYSK